MTRRIIVKIDAAILADREAWAALKQADRLGRRRGCA